VATFEIGHKVLVPVLRPWALALELIQEAMQVVKNEVTEVNHDNIRCHEKLIIAVSFCGSL
jgi:hypothetical protein